MPFLLPSALEHPRAPWWQTEPDPPAGLVPTAAIAGLLHRHRVAHPWLEGATAFTWRAADAITQTNPYEVRPCSPSSTTSPTGSGPRRRSGGSAS